jgi:hypothetical protein
MRTSRLVSAAAAFVFPFLAVACSSEPKPLQVTYYYNPG